MLSKICLLMRPIAIKNMYEPKLWKENKMFLEP